jgi:hypothetical protein
MNVKSRIEKAEKRADGLGVGCVCGGPIPIIEVFDGEPAPPIPERPRCPVHPARPGAIVIDFIEVVRPRPGAAERNEDG